MSDKNQAVPVSADELAQLRMDAARYRFIRSIHSLTVAASWILSANAPDVETPEQFDAAIDAEIDKEQRTHAPKPWPFTPLDSDHG